MTPSTTVDSSVFQGSACMRLRQALLAVALAAFLSLCALGSPAFADEAPSGNAIGGSEGLAAGSSTEQSPAPEASDGASSSDAAPAGDGAGDAGQAGAQAPDASGMNAEPPAAYDAAAPAPAEDEDEASAKGMRAPKEDLEPGWHDLEGGRVYVGSDGVKASGWTDIEGSRYYFDPVTNFMAKGLTEVDGSIYLLDPDTGVMRTGWVKLSDGWHYFGADGAAKSGWFKDEENDGAWYYLSSSGRAKTGWLKDGGSWYYLRSSGRMDTGWLKYEGSWYYLAGSGRMQTGWLKSEGDWYYLRPSGRMDTGWTKVSGSWYHLRASGRMDTGWIKYEGSWYYLAGSGRMQTGWLKYDGDWYYLYGSGRMASDDTVDGYYLAGSGRWLSDSDLVWANSFYSDTNYLIIVDTDSNWVTVYKGEKGYRYELRSFRCSSGAYSTPTVTGSFEVGDKGYVFGHGNYRCYYYTQFYGDYLFHSVLYRPGGGILDGRLGYNISHGCVRLDIDDAEWIYDYIPRGTKVYVY